MADISANIVVGMPAQLFTRPERFSSVSNGKIYIGNVDTDPTVAGNQIQVYIQGEDDSLTPVAQPLRTNNGGYPVYNGQVVRFVTTTNYSMSVLDSGNVQLFYFANLLKYSFEQDRLRAQLASSLPGNGASLVNTESGQNVQDYLDSNRALYEGLIAGDSSSAITTIGETLENHTFGYDSNMALYTKDQLQSPATFRKDGFDLRSGVFEGILIITMGPTGDFTSLNAAIAFASLFKPKYVNSPGYIHNRIEIEIQSGVIITEQVVARQIDLSHITLTSVDPIVKVNVPTTLWWMYGEFAAHLPIIGTIFDLQRIGFDGLSLKMGSQAIIEYGHSRNGKPSTKYAGIINAARHNIFINTECRFVGRECIFTGAAEAGVHFEKHCTGCVRDADISGNTLFGIRLINGSTIDCYGVDVSNTSSGPGIQAEVGSSASGFGIVASNSKQGLRASLGSRITATGSTFNTMAASDAWAYASDGSDIVMTTATGSGGAAACLATGGARIDIAGVDVSAAGSASSQIRCLSGSIICATGSTGTLNKTANTIDANGIIFK